MIKEDKFADQFELIDIFKPLEHDSSLIMRHMFGGLAIYFNGLLVCCLTEDPTDNTWKGKSYDYPIWHGLLLATSREHHSSLTRELPELAPHPVLGKWLYLPLNDETDFRLSARKIMHLIFNGDARLGVTPATRKSKRSLPTADKRRSKPRRKK